MYPRRFAEGATRGGETVDVQVRQIINAIAVDRLADSSYDRGRRGAVRAGAMTPHPPPLIRHIALVGLLWLGSGLVIWLAVTRDYTPRDDLTTLRWVIFALFAPIVLKYLIQLSVTPFAALRDRRDSRRRQTSEAPLVSVLVPAWNEEAGILKTVSSILRSLYPNFEIVVIKRRVDRPH